MFCFCLPSLKDAMEDMVPKEKLEEEIAHAAAAYEKAGVLQVSCVLRDVRDVAVCCSVLQCVAVCCSVLQCVAVCCGVLQLSCESRETMFLFQSSK